MDRRVGAWQIKGRDVAWQNEWQNGEWQDDCRLMHDRRTDRFVGQKENEKKKRYLAWQNKCRYQALQNKREVGAWQELSLSCQMV